MNLSWLREPFFDANHPAHKKEEPHNQQEYNQITTTVLSTRTSERKEAPSSTMSDAITDNGGAAIQDGVYASAADDPIW